MTDVARAILAELRRQEAKARDDVERLRIIYGNRGNLAMAICGHKAAWLRNEVIPAVERIVADGKAEVK